MTEDAQAALLGRLRKKSHEELLFVMEQLLERKPDIDRFSKGVDMRLLGSKCSI